MVETILLQLLLEYEFESNNIFVMHKDGVDFEKEIRNENGKKISFELHKEKEETREDDEFLFFLFARNEDRANEIVWRR